MSDPKVIILNEWPKNQGNLGIGKWKNPDPKECPYVVFRTEDYNKLQKVFDAYKCREAIRATGITVGIIRAESVLKIAMGEAYKDSIDHNSFWAKLTKAE